MSERKPDAEQGLLGLLVDDAEAYERMLEEGHRELCIEYQSLIPGIVDAQVVGRQLTGELREARDYLKKCKLCAETLASSSRALRELAAEDGQVEDEPYDPPKKDPPPRPPEAPGRLVAWWRRFSRSRGGLIAIVGAVLCAIALAGLFLQSGQQCAREEARRDRADAAVAPVSPADAGSARAPDAALDPRSWLRKKGPLTFVFITLHLARQRQAASRQTLRGVARELARLTAGAAALSAADRKRLRASVTTEGAAVGRLAGPIAQAAKFVASVKDDGMTPDFDAQLEAAKRQLRARQQDQAALDKQLKELRKKLGL